VHSQRRATSGAILQRLAAAFPSQNSITADTLKVYIESLSDYSPEVLAQAAQEWIRTGKFFPKVAELREIADRIAKQSRAEPDVLALPEYASWEQDREASEREPERVERARAELNRRVGNIGKGPR